MGKTARAIVASPRQLLDGGFAPKPPKKSAPRAAGELHPTIARGELVGKVARARFDEEIDAALQRRPTNEKKLAGALRAVAPLSAQVRGSLANAASVLLRRRTLDRDLYVASVRSLAECKDGSAAGVLREALGSDDVGGTATLCAAASCDDAELGPLLSKIAGGRHSHLAFGAEVARIARRESNGAHLLSLAPKIKEAHRITLCVELFVPLARGEALAPSIARPLYVLAEAERHLGRWLVLAEIATKAGDAGALAEAKSRAGGGAASSRAAWSLVAWALEQTWAQQRRGAQPAQPETRPTVELVARLSDRPSADRDTTFLFRLAHAKAPAARAMLEALAKPLPLTDEVGVRAALHLARDYGRDDLRAELLALARGARREDLRGLAMAALWDVGEQNAACDLADELVTSKCLANVVWASLVRANVLGHASARLCTESRVRWIHLGWLE